MTELPFDPRECALALSSVALRDALAAMSRLVLCLEHGKHHGIGLGEVREMLADLGPGAEMLFGHLLPSWVAVSQADTANLLHGQEGRA
jgi:hypothetical protein